MLSPLMQQKTVLSRSVQALSDPNRLDCRSDDLQALSLMGVCPRVHVCNLSSDVCRRESVHVILLTIFLSLCLTACLMAFCIV